MNPSLPTTSARSWLGLRAYRVEGLGGFWHLGSAVGAGCCGSVYRLFETGLRKRGWGADVCMLPSC